MRLKCEKCGEYYKITNTFKLEGDNRRYRRRKCQYCGNVMFSEETPISEEVYKEQFKIYLRRRKIARLSEAYKKGVI